MSQTSERRHDLDALRAVAMLLGIALHAGLSFITFGWVVQDSKTHWAFDLAFAAIHGFRMPVFFVMSGFFTAMLWRRRGLRSLLWHRVRRIALPLALCMVTVIPAMNWAIGFAFTSGAKGPAERHADADPRESIWAAARAGDVDAIKAHLDAGADVNERDPKLNMPPLMLAAISDHPEAVDVLVRSGADIEAQDDKGSTALLIAAFFGRAGSVERLVAAGADVNARNDDGSTPRDMLSVDWGTTLLIASLVGVDVDQQETTDGRSKVAEMIGGTVAVRDLDIWVAARVGDVRVIKENLDKGADVDAGDPQTGVPPLALATLFGHPEAVDALIQSGADVNGRDRLGSTALHGAAFLGHVRSAGLLLDAGADPDTRNSDGATPRDSLSVDWGTTLFIAGLLGIQPEQQQVEEGREKVSALFDAVPTDGAAKVGPNRGDKRDALAGLIGWLMHVSVFHHLWFLWHLCWLVLAFAIYATLADRFGWRGLPVWATLSAARWLWVLPLTVVPQWFMEGFGPDTSAGILPMPRVLGYYAIFFFYGVFYYDSDDEEGRGGKWWPVTVPMALFAVAPTIWTLEGDLRDAIDAPVGLMALHLGATTLKVVYTWWMTFGLMGMFRALMKRESKATRYVSDSSYWLYIAHLPLIILAQAWVRYWPLPALVKFSAICVVVTGVLLLVYQVGIRYTIVGTMLNGPRQRPRKAAADPA